MRRKNSVLQYLPAYLDFNSPYTLSSNHSHLFLDTYTNNKIQSTLYKCCTSQHIIRYTRRKSNLYTVHYVNAYTLSDAAIYPLIIEWSGSQPRSCNHTVKLYINIHNRATLQCSE